MRAKFYVGLTPFALGRVAFAATREPTEKSTRGKFVSVMGPFRTLRAAEYYAANRSVNTVKQAEEAC